LVKVEGITAEGGEVLADRCFVK